MKKFYKTYVLLFILIILSVLVLILDNPEKSAEKENQQFNKPIISNIDVVNKFIIKNKDSEIIFKKSEKKWLIENAGNSLANFEEVDKLLSNLEAMTRENVISEDKTQWSYFEVDENTGRQIILFNDEKKIAAFFVGRSGNPNFDDQYIRIENENIIYKTQGILDDIFSKTIEQWKTEVEKEEPVPETK
ncbi:hypothetical protein A2483_00975 [Candidatus Peregrinibacteria bacterium RIFOXYC2_FULL_33_13]|nr:MAG: hypothetical protein UR27_C0015G0025 [Candidatus Peregrinibacteria bacterium GW2011_GWA2_33_10]KKP39527.1 MAG: hypothetical protein UR30_C0010G0023 [Candidatus Peregrinibacteria bacterium GW2011_GWC2_33_13]OGJ46657.1 MAG: hypothetical protein A2229_04545 [Candidatus Peregrinibacteria bacterium RIFOXYA2_FULL_33_7]OGJ52202.1 MAG: hypothetical protein A2483_00975 [Candidatus Peregrinibacteria bacterium RIFOXYC2_FULL_33_13]